MPIKSQFPYFAQAENNQLVYLDSAATTHKPKAVIDALCRFYSADYATVHRASYQQANKATEQYELARQKVASFINAKNSSDIVWTKGTTESINLAVYAWAKHIINKGDLILVSGSEHHANFVPWQQLAVQNDAQLAVVDMLPNGMPDPVHYQSLLSQGPKIVALQHCSNVLGNILPVKEMTAAAQRQGAKVLIDGAQAIGHFAVDVTELNCDLYAFSGHKMYGPTGIGVLYIKDAIKSEFAPFHYGGEMVKSVALERTEYNPIPSLLESGTPNIAGVIGLSAAIDFMRSEQFTEANQTITGLFGYLIEQLQQFDNLIYYGDLNNNVGILSFNIEDEAAADVATLLSQQNIAVRTGFHCAMPMHKQLGTGGAVRLSLAVYNDQNDVDNFVTALAKTIELLDI